MSEIIIEVPKTTNMFTTSIPFGKEKKAYWQFTVIFEDDEYLNRRIVTVMDNNLDDNYKNLSAQSQIVKNGGKDGTEFEYHYDQTNVKADIKITVYFLEKNRLVRAEW